MYKYKYKSFPTIKLTKIKSNKEIVNEIEIIGNNKRISFNNNYEVINSFNINGIEYKQINNINDLKENEFVVDYANKYIYFK